MRISGGRQGSQVSRGRRQGLLTAVVALAALALPFVLPGCAIEVGLTTVVEGDGSGKIGVRLAADKELQDALSQAAAGLGNIADLGSFVEGIGDEIPDDVDAIFALLIGQIPTDWSVDQGTDSYGVRWMSLSHDFDSPGDLQKLTSGRVLSTFIDPDRFSFSQERGFFRTTTTYSIAAGLSGALAEKHEIGDGLLAEVVGEMLTFENRVTLPGVIKANNADRVEGNTLVWDVGLTGYREIYGESLSYDWVHIGVVALAGLVGLLILILVVVLLIRRRRRRRSAAVTPPPAAAAPTAATAPTPPEASEAAAYMAAYAAEDKEPPEDT